MAASGCSSKVTLYATPPFPDPTDNALTKIQALHDPDVDNWMISLFKLKEELAASKKFDDSMNSQTQKDNL